MVRNDGGRLFQTSGPLTANARRPSSVRVRRMTAAPSKPSAEIVAVGPTRRSRRGLSLRIFHRSIVYLCITILSTIM